jgi:hypothetical protein
MTKQYTLALCMLLFNLMLIVQLKLNISFFIIQHAKKLGMERPIRRFARAVPAHRLGRKRKAAPLVDHQPTALRTWLNLKQLDHSGYNYPYPLEHNNFDSHSSRVGRRPRYPVTVTSR